MKAQIQYLKEETEETLTALATLLNGKSPFKTEVKTFWCDIYQTEIEGLKIFHEEHDDFFSFIAKREIEVEAKSIIPGKKRIRNMYCVWIPELDEGDSSVGLAESWVNQIEYESEDESFESSRNGILHAINAMLRIQIGFALDSGS